MSNQWHAPITWTAQQFVDEDDLNEQIRNNLEFLKSRPLNAVTLTTVTTTNTSFVELTGSSISVTGYGGNFIIAANGATSNSTGGATITLDLAIDGNRQGDATFGLASIHTPTANYTDNAGVVFFTTTPPSAGAHNYSVYWKVSAGTGSALLRVYACEIR